MLERVFSHAVLGPLPTDAWIGPRFGMCWFSGNCTCFRHGGQRRPS